MSYGFKILFRAGLVFALSLAGGATLFARVVDPTPDFTWTNAAGQAQSASQFRKQPVVILVAPGPRSWVFRSQVGQLQRVFQRLSATGAICVAAFTESTGQIRSDIPFVLATDGPRVAFLYGVQGRFAVIVLGKDGNIDVNSPRVLKGQRILDIIGNSFVVQSDLRRN
jgi:peroxiredoxin